MPHNSTHTNVHTDVHTNDAVGTLFKASDPAGLATITDGMAIHRHEGYSNCNHKNNTHNSDALKSVPTAMKHNWEYKNWNEVLTIYNGKNQKAVENPCGTYPIYGSGGIMNYADNYICPENCTIIGRKGNINNPIFVPTKFLNVDTAFGLCPKDCLQPRYLYYFCEN